MADLTGIATWTFREGSLAYRIERFAAMGFEAVSLSAGDAGALCRGAAPDVEEAIAKRGIAVTIHAGFTAGGVPVPIDSILADFESYAAWNAKTGALHTVNYDAARVRTGEGEREYQVDVMHPALKRMLAASNGAGFSVGVEDWPRNREQLEAVADLQAYPHFGVLVDLGHLNLRVHRDDGLEAGSYVDAARRCLDGFELPINELHVHNNDGLRDCHAPPTAGTADMAALADLLRRKGARCISTIEIVPAWCGLDEQQAWQAAKESLEFWRSTF